MEWHCFVSTKTMSSSVNHFKALEAEIGAINTTIWAKMKYFSTYF